MAAPGALLLFVFAYLPMVGIIIAFKDYRFDAGILNSAWVGLDNFRFLFGTDSAWRITRNTLLMNLLFITVSTAGALVVAILMNEVYTSRLSKYYQTALFFPYFISWVIVSYFVFALLNGNTGLVNKVLDGFGLETIRWYREAAWWPLILTLAHLWNGLGFGSLIYLSGILRHLAGTIRGGPASMAPPRQSKSNTSRCPCCTRSSSSWSCWLLDASSMRTSACSSSCRGIRPCCTGPRT